MALLNGNVVIRAGSADPIIFQLLYDDEVTPISLAGISLLTLRLEDINTQEVKTFTSPKLTVIDIPLGKIKLSQTSSDFTALASYIYYVTFTDVDGKAHSIPEDKFYNFRVERKIGTY